MYCAFCGKEVAGSLRRYCSDKCRQAMFRKRHPERTLRNELRLAKRRIALLEAFAVQHAPKGFRKTREVQPVTLTDMVRDHGIASGTGSYLDGAISIGLLKPTTDGMLDAEQQEHFWQLCNGHPGWHPCPHCPHGLIP